MNVVIKTYEAAVAYSERAFRLQPPSDREGILIEGTYASFGEAIEQAVRAGASLEHAYLDSFDAERRNLSGAKFPKAFLFNARLAGTDLSNADLTKADLRYAGLVGINLERAQMDFVHLYSSDLIGANMRGVSMQAAVAPRCTFNEVDLSEAKLAGTDFGCSDFRGTKLVGADLSNALLEHTDFREADLRGCNLKGARVEGANFEGAIIDEHTQLDVDWQRAGMSFASGEAEDTATRDETSPSLAAAAHDPEGAPEGEDEPVIFQLRSAIGSGLRV